MRDSSRLGHLHTVRRGAKMALPGPYSLVDEVLTMPRRATYSPVRARMRMMRIGSEDTVALDAIAKAVAGYAWVAESALLDI